MADLARVIEGILLGTAVGDAVGLPREGISRRRAARMFGGEVRHRFFFGRGMISDDTEHSFFVAQALLAHPDDAEAFARSLAWKLRGWLLLLPAGIGLATMRSCLKLLIGFPPEKSGVFSAGNGPAMRCALLGAWFADDENACREYVRVATRITHTDSKALTGGLAVARCAGLVGKEPPAESVFEMLSALDPDDAEWQEWIARAEAALAGGESVGGFANSLGLERGVSGYMYHTVPVAIYAWLRHRGDFRATLEAVLLCGGDSDTVGAIAGALAGAVTGAEGIPREWLEAIVDWPRSIALLREIANRLALQKQAGRALGPVSYFWPGLLLRNPFFVLIVLLHCFRRLLPPY